MIKKEFVEYQKGLTEVPNDPIDIIKYISGTMSDYINKNNLDDEAAKILEDVYRQVCYFLTVCLNPSSCSILSNKKTAEIVGKIAQFDNKSIQSEEELNIEYIITLLFCLSLDCIFEEKNSRKNISENQSAIVFVGYLNELLKNNNYERTFTIIELYHEYEKEHHRRDMMRLHSFIADSAKYYERLKNGNETIDNIYEEFATDNGVNRISKNGTCYYTKEQQKLEGAKDIEMPPREAEYILREVDAMACAYYHYKEETEKPVLAKKNTIPCRIKKMRTRDS